MTTSGMQKKYSKITGQKGKKKGKAFGLTPSRIHASHSTLAQLKSR